MSIAPTSILITGGNGNIARLLAKRLLTDSHSVACLDIAEPSPESMVSGATYLSADICDQGAIEDALNRFKPTIIFHLASLLSGSSEQDRRRAFNVNAVATFNLYELALTHGSPMIVFPGTGASYGSDVPSTLPEDHPQWPENIYGVTKIANERLGVYYKLTHGLDFRCLRPPLVLSPYAPAAALTAYASHAYVAASRGEPFTFPVAPDIGMSTIYIEDLVEGFVQLASASATGLTQHAYNVHALCPTAQEVAHSIRSLKPEFEYDFKPDPNVEALLVTAPNEFVDETARQDWGWNPRSALDDCSRALFELLES